MSLEEIEKELENYVCDMKARVWDMIEDAVQCIELEELKYLTDLAEKIEFKIGEVPNLIDEIHEIAHLVSALEKKEKAFCELLESSNLDLGARKVEVPPGQFNIQVNWKNLGKGNNTEIIFQKTASKTLALFFAKMYNKLGSAFLEKVSKYPISRGPFISKIPSKDFLNEQNGTLYAHSEIGESGYFVLTHSDTPQKLKDIEGLCQFLGYPSDTFIAKVGKE